MKLQLTDAQVVQMAKLAVIASQPAGMGFLQYDPTLKVEHVVITTREGYGSGMFVSIDYYQGRMVKFHARKQPDGTWEFDNTTSHDYQSWKSKYDGYDVLAEAVTDEKTS